ncbi:MAG: hypothetical protein AAFP13_12705 [Pseudomonadota bacterium]
MKLQDRWSGLLLAGAGARLVVAAGIVLLLWLGFFWATGTPGSLLEAGR